ncbi:hypothetical protein WKV44_00300 [Spirochaetia bacterium 38H-sp]|uniref:Uncharacterized protein n=1 Tax=Rarispira pelagica TaxID=3141764 RepID=A0ABU9U8I0_9SPIR
MLDLFFALVTYFSLPERGVEWVFVSPSSVYECFLDRDRVVFELMGASSDSGSHGGDVSDSSVPVRVVVEPLSSRANVLVVSYSDKDVAVDLYSVLELFPSERGGSVVDFSYNEQSASVFFDGDVLILSSDNGVFSARFAD